MTEHDGQGPENERRRERLISTQCRVCGASITYAGTGRWPQFCSPACRQHAWSLRHAADELSNGSPLPSVVREVVECHTQVPTAPQSPRVAADWIPLLEQLEGQLQEDPLAVIRSQEELEDLASVVLALHTAVTGRARDQ